MRRHTAALLALACVITATPAAGSSEEGRSPCARREPLRRAFFGDLHVHTAFSQDASTQGTRTRPPDAYAFARGARIGVQPYDETGSPLRTLRLERPLDFAAVTDHAEQLGETRICSTPSLPGYDSWICRLYRRWPRAAFFVMNTRAAYSETPTRFGFCGEEGRVCLDAARSAWRETIAAAEAAYDRSSECRFTTFIGYEWTAAPGSNNLHRNVIFAGDRAIDLPVSAFEASTPWALWRELRAQCIDRGDGCDVLTIPHNSNLSGGLMFAPYDSEGEPLAAAAARERAELEPLVEILQHKGDSECVPSPTTVDELCNFEKLPYSNFRGKYVRGLRRPPDPRSFVRDALKAGLVEEQRMGVNPFKLGFVASTDTHLAAAGAVEEGRFLGHGGAGVPARYEIPPGLPDEIEFNPGGLAVLWAEENTRASLFAAMKRKEAYATSGPRIVLRFFGGWGYGDDLCEDVSAFASTGYSRGVPMGGDLRPPSPPHSPPRFAVWALSDAGAGGSPAIPLERIQIVKGWLGADGEAKERVYDVARSSASGAAASADPATCRAPSEGPKSLCAVWSDPDFRAQERAFYYVRVLQAPTCRWSQLLCNGAGVRCDDRGTIGRGFEGCCKDSHQPLIQERAWSSPIWYSPAAG